MELIIDIPEEIYKVSKIIDVQYEDVVQIPLEAIANGTPIPKGHGRLIDADDIDNHIIGHVDTRDCPTIIEADKEREV